MYFVAAPAAVAVGGGGTFTGPWGIGTDLPCGVGNWGAGRWYGVAAGTDTFGAGAPLPNIGYWGCPAELNIGTA